MKNKLNKVSDAGVVSEPEAAYSSARAGAMPAAWVVTSYIAPQRGHSHPSPSPTKLVKVVRDGLPVEELDALQALLGVPIEELAPILGISKATLHRRRNGENLTAAESDRVIRFARLMGRAIDVMESREAARVWLRTPQLGLGGEMPLVYAQTEVGAREVENLLGRIELGVYS